jgi:hypothetical protein
VILPSVFVRREQIEASAREERARQVAAEHVRLPLPTPAAAASSAGARPRQRRLAGRLARNPLRDALADGAAPSYFYVLDLGGLHGLGEVRVPIYRQPSPRPDILRKEIYSAEVASLKLEAGNLTALEGMIAEAAGSLLGARYLPRFWFTLPDGGSVPVFARNGHCEARVPGGPLMVAENIGGLRERLREYLARFDGAAAPGEVSVLALAHDLRYVRPIAALVAYGVWFPVLQVGETLVVERNGHRVVFPHRGDVAAGLLDLRREIAAELVAGGIIGSPGELRLEAADGETAAHLREALGPPCGHMSHLRSTGQGLARVALPVFRLNGEFICASGKEPPSFSFGGDEHELREQMIAELERNGGLFNRDAFRFEPEAAGVVRRVS